MHGYIKAPNVNFGGPAERVTSAFVSPPRSDYSIQKGHIRKGSHGELNQTNIPSRHNRLGHDNRNIIGKQREVRGGRSFNGVIQGGDHNEGQRKVPRAQLDPSFHRRGEPNKPASNHRVQPTETSSQATRGLNKATVAWGTEPLVVEPASNRGVGGSKARFSPAYTPPADEPASFPWGALIPPGIMLAGMAEAVAGKKLRRSSNTRIVQVVGAAIEGAGLFQTAAGTVLACGSSFEAIQQATKAPIEAPKPTDTARPPEAKPTREPEMTLNYLKDPTINSPLADWQTFNVNGAPWIYHEQRFEEDGHGELNVFHPVDNSYSGIAFGSRTYWALGAPVAPGVVEATEMQFYMMYTQRSSAAPVEVGMLITTNPNQIKEDYVIADIFHLSDDKLLVKDPNIQVKIQRNSENQIMFTLIRYGTEFPLTTINSSAKTPTPIDSTIYNVKYLQHDPGMFAFGGEVSPSSGSEFKLASLGLSPELAAALQKHGGLEASITAEAGTYSTQVTVLNAEGQPVTQRMEVTPATMTENLTTKNKYGNTPVMETADGKKLYWIEGLKAWFSVELSTDINNPIFVPYNNMEVATRVMIAEHPEPFSQAALDQWKKIPGLGMYFQYFTGSNMRAAFLRSHGFADSDLTMAERTTTPFAERFYTKIPDGTRFDLIPLGWIDPSDQNNPTAGEWKLLWGAVGQEILSNPDARAYFEKYLNDAKNDKPGSEVTLVLAADEGFFDSTNGLFTIGAQPSLKKLLSLPGNDPRTLNNPNTPGLTFAYWIDQALQSLSPTRLIRELAFIDNDPNIQEGFVPDDIQLYILPSIIIRR